MSVKNTYHFVYTEPVIEDRFRKAVGCFYRIVCKIIMYEFDFTKLIQKSEIVKRCYC